MLLLLTQQATWPAGLYGLLGNRITNDAAQVEGLDIIDGIAGPPFFMLILILYACSVPPQFYVYMVTVFVLLFHVTMVMDSSRFHNTRHAAPCMSW